MSSIQLAIVANTSASVSPPPPYSFLSHPPQKQRPTQPLPSPPVYISDGTPSPKQGRRRSTTITAWIENVQPGTPPPRTPRRRDSFSFSPYPPRRPSVPRRQSVDVNSARVSRLPSFFNYPDTPSVDDIRPDLKSIGYTSAFVNFQDIILPPPVKPFISRLPIPPVPSTPNAVQRGLKHIRSLSTLRPSRHSRTNSTPMPPPSTIRKGPDTSMAPSEAKRMRTQSSVAISRSKKAKYKVLPPTLANELALAQFVDGGNVEDHIKNYNRAHAKSGGAAKVNGQLVGVGDVYRDGEGNVWRDPEEEWEFAHLLGGDEDFCMDEVEWVPFGPHPDQVRNNRSGGNPSTTLEDEERRGSVSTVSTQDSDLDPRYAMKAEGGSQDDLASFGGALSPHAFCKPGMSVLAIPAQTQRTAKHLRKPEFLLDVFPVPASPFSSSQPRSPLTPRGNVTNVTSHRPSEKAKRRPPPLSLTPTSPAFICPMNPLDPEEGRKDFLASSFAPPPSNPVSPITAKTNKFTVPQKKHPLKTPKTSMLNMNVKGILKAVGGSRKKF